MSLRDVLNTKAVALIMVIFTVYVSHGSDVALQELQGDIKKAHGIIRSVLFDADFKNGDINTESIRWALEALNNPSFAAERYANAFRKTLTISQADNLLKIKTAFLKEKRPDDTRNIRLLNNMIKEKPCDFNNPEEAQKAIAVELWIWKSLKSHAQYNTPYENIEDALVMLQRNNAQLELAIIFARYPKEMEEVIEEFNKRTKLHEDAGTDVLLRNNVVQFMHQVKPLAKHIETYKLS